MQLWPWNFINVSKTGMKKCKMYRLHLGNIWKDLTLVVFAKKSAQRFCTVGATCQLWVRFISAKEKCSTRKMSQSWSTFHLQKSMFWAWFWRAFHTFSCSGPPSLGMNCLTLSDTATPFFFQNESQNPSVLSQINCWNSVSPLSLFFFFFCGCNNDLFF